MTPSVVTSWYGAFLVQGGTVVRSVRSPLDTASLAERVRARRTGHLTPEEETLLAERGSADWSTRDRRLVAYGVRLDPMAPADLEALMPGVDAGLEDPSFCREVSKRWRRRGIRRSTSRRPSARPPTSTECTISWGNGSAVGSPGTALRSTPATTRGRRASCSRAGKNPLLPPPTRPWSRPDVVSPSSTDRSRRPARS